MNGWYGFDLDGTLATYDGWKGAEHIGEPRCLKHIGKVLPITCVKDFGMISFYDDRCVQIEPNTGRRMDGAR